MRIPSITVALTALTGILTVPSHAEDESAQLESELLRALDRDAEPCTDFFQFACGNWLAENPIPADQARWGRFNVLQENNREILRGLLETEAERTEGRNGVEQKIGDYYEACMAEDEIEKAGLKPVQADLQRIDAVESLEDLQEVVLHLHRIGVNAIFDFDSVEDFKDSSQVIAVVDQAGLGLPDRDFYFREDEKSKETREKYVAHVGRMLQLSGLEEAKTKAAAETVMSIETRLAEASLDRVSRRNPMNVYHKMNLEELAGLTPSFTWPRYFAGLDVPDFSSLNVTVPDFFKKLESTLSEMPIANWKLYLRARLLEGSAPFLPKAFVEENFDFYGRTLSGAEEMQPRWKRCVRYTDSDLGEALGQKYVEEAFTAESKRRMLKLVRRLAVALEEDIRELNWMGEETKKLALAKLDSISNKIGYPDEWRDYSKLEVARGDALGNSQRANRFDLERRLAKIGQPVDKNEWFMSPPTVNAYYHPLHNNINFPAGILQPPFFDAGIDDAMNYGAIGAVIGHELTHGFDDQGRKFDAQGNLEDWWTEEDAKGFEERAECFNEQYSEYVAADDVKVNGKLTLGENTADNGGLRIAYMALQEATANTPDEKIDGFTRDQRFFLSWAQVWCMNIRDEMARVRAQTDTHSPAQHRVMGVISNMPEFHKAFGCKAGDPMVRERICRVW